MYDNSQKTEKAILVGVCRNLADRLSDTTSESMRELGCLAETAGAEVLGEITQNREAPDKATFVGEGKLFFSYDDKAFRRNARRKSCNF